MFILLLSWINVSEGTWDPYCPWDQPGIDKQLYSCSNNISNIQLNPSSLANQRKKIKVGLLFPQDPANCTYIDLFNQGMAAEIAVEDVNSNPDLIPEFELELVNASEYKSCGRTFDTLGYAYTLRVEHGANVLIGPACGDRSSGESVATFATAENVPVISVASFQDNLNDVKKYPTFTRLYESTEIQAYYHAGIYEYFGWKEIVTVVQREKKSGCTAKWANLTRTLRDEIGYDKIKSYTMLANNTLSEKRIIKMLEQNRIISVFSSPQVFRELVLSFYRICLKQPWCDWRNYRFIAVNFQIGLVFSNQQILPWRCDQSCRMGRLMCKCCSEDEKKDDDDAKLAFRSVIYVVPNLPKFTEQDEFFCRLMKKITKKNTCIESIFLSQHVYDTILVYSHALHKTKDPTDGRKISDEIKRLDIITGKTGKIITNPRGSRYSEMSAYFLLKDSDEEMTAVLLLSPTRATGSYTASEVDTKISPIKVPDRPPCEWHDFSDRCSGPRTTLILAVCVVIVSIFTITILRIWLTRRRVPRQSFFLTSEQLQRLIEINTEGTEGDFKPVFVSKTDIVVSPTDKRTVTLLRELNRIHHSNIVQLLHCCLDTAGLAIVLEDCPKGPLQHLIRTEQRVHSASFIRSFAADILRGLSYLNGSAFSYHGSLTSLNCVVDAHWNVKLKGFYWRHIQEGEVYTNRGVEMRELNGSRQVYDKLWMSPQLLNGEITDILGFRENDIYSFGVILAELIKSEPPFRIFYDENINVQVLLDQIELIKKGEKPLDDETLKTMSFGSKRSSTNSKNSKNTHTAERESSVKIKRISSSVRSDTLMSISESETESTISGRSSESEDFDDDLNFVKQLSFLCTLHKPEDRPTVGEILERLETGSQCYIGSLVDQWLVTLERKSRELKELFDVKNKDLLKEKERTKELVYSLLPREIAEQKMTSKAPIAPQVFSNCSFFYSDIKGFTSIVADLTSLEDGGPMDVVEMLDNLYTIMDKAIGKHNVVKIETIGDAYVVVSGLPVPDVNGSAHARHIAAFALDVLSTTKDIRVKRLNNRPVYMRIGIHSGSCVAGLAGNYMYHYCIYGKEPRYANNLESSGEANRIHMSNDMRHILDNNFQNQFSYMERKPSINIPGFKTRRTWWLTGEAGVPREMPDDPIYSRLEFKRRISNTSVGNTRLLKGISKLRNEVNSFHSRERSISSDNSGKKKTSRLHSLSGLKAAAAEKTQIGRSNSRRKDAFVPP